MHSNSTCCINEVGDVVFTNTLVFISIEALKYKNYINPIVKVVYYIIVSFTFIILLVLSHPIVYNLRSMI